VGGYGRFSIVDYAVAFRSQRPLFPDTATKGGGVCIPVSRDIHFWYGRGAVAMTYARWKLTRVLVILLVAGVGSFPAQPMDGDLLVGCTFSGGPTGLLGYLPARTSFLSTLVMEPSGVLFHDPEMDENNVGVIMGSYDNNRQLSRAHVLRASP